MGEQLINCTVVFVIVTISYSKIQKAVPLDLWSSNKFTNLKERQQMLRCARLTMGFFSSLAMIQLVKETSPLSRFVRIKYSRLTAIVAKLCMILKPSYHVSYISTSPAGGGWTTPCADLAPFATTRTGQVWIAIAWVVAGPTRFLSPQFCRSLEPWFPTPSSRDFEFLSSSQNPRLTS